MLRFIEPQAVLETILLVDDNPLRSLLRQSLLKDYAPAVMRVMDAGEALCMVQSPEIARRLALVITGHKMSGISGPEFVAELRSRLPHVVVLVLSTTPSAEIEYLGMPGVFYSETRSTDDLRILAAKLLRLGEKQTA